MSLTPMLTCLPRHNPVQRPWRALSVWVVLLILCGFCLPAQAEQPGAQLLVQPQTITLRGAAEQHGLVATLVGADGNCSDVTERIRLTSADAAVVLAGEDRIIRPAGDGKTEITVELDGLTAKVPVMVERFAAVAPPSFRQDVLPVLTRYGCNSGGCHGKQAGQNGFKLSLRGYAADWDHAWLTADLRSRRIDPAFPEKSLLLLKATAKVPHEGRARFAEGDRGHRVLADWIRARTPAADPAEADAVRLEVLPGDRTLGVGESQQLLVLGHWPDGHIRDVTWLSQFHSNSPSHGTVTPEGLVRSLHPGEVSVRVHFQGQVGVALFTTPYPDAVDPAQYASRANIVDEHVFNKLQSLRIPVSGACDDATFLRRVSLDLTGTLPTADDARTFAADTDAEKRSKLIDRLLGSKEFVDYWTMQLCDLLQNRKERDGDVRGTKGVRAFQVWLRGEVAANRPWNEIAKSVLTATGDSVSTPQVGYFITTQGGRSAEDSEVADAVAQSFLGTRIGCAKCHNHPLEKFTQDDYYHFAAFFAKVRLRREDPSKGPTALAVMTQEEQDRQNELKNAKTEMEATTALAAGEGPEADQAKQKVAELQKRIDELNRRIEEIRAQPPTAGQPRTGQRLTAQPLDRAPMTFAPGQDPREALATWMTDPQNEAFAGAMVNRMWRHFMGVGLVEPVDDLRSTNPPSNPQLWEALKGEFVGHGYDLRHLMRLILNSRAYQLSAETLPGNEKDRRYHSHYYARRLPAEVLLDAVSNATGVPENFPGYPLGTRAVQLPEPAVSSYFLSLFGRSERITACACERSGEVTLPQLLHLTNGTDVLNKIRSPEGKLAALLKDPALAGDDRKLVEEIFLATVSRSPTEAEASAVLGVIGAGDPKEEVFHDLFWAMLNAKEFAFNH